MVDNVPLINATKNVLPTAVMAFSFRNNRRYKSKVNEAFGPMMPTTLVSIKEKKIKTNDSKSVGLGVAEMETMVVKLKNLTIGKLSFAKLEVAVLPIAHVNETYRQINLPPIDGVIGSDFFMKYKAIINYRNGEVVINTTKK
jgi:hypothetical protein